jgi:hypothetical protein
MLLRHVLAQKHRVLEQHSERGAAALRPQGLPRTRRRPARRGAQQQGRHLHSGTDRWKAGMIPVPLLDRMYGQVAIPLILAALTAGRAPPG